MSDLARGMPAAIERFRDVARQLKRAKLGLEYLMVCVGSGVLDEYPELRRLIADHGETMLAGIESRVRSDAEVLGEIITAA